VENDDNGELFEVDWTGEGDYGLDFGWWCTDSYDGDSVFIESYVSESEDGSEVIMIDLPLGGNATILTGLEISGENESIYTGFVDTDTNSIHFEQWYDGELWKERDYTDCHE
jgi:subtilase family serine protease